MQKCSQCGATKTPMWRNDTQGNKTLCNACGVRLQRQLNKQKQQTQPVQPQPTTLIAGGHSVVPVPQVHIASGGLVWLGGCSYAPHDPQCPLCPVPRALPEAGRGG